MQAGGARRTGRNRKTEINQMRLDATSASARSDRSVEHVQPKRRVVAMPVDPLERITRAQWQWWKRRIVLEVHERAIARPRHDRAWIEHTGRVECCFHSAECIDRFRWPDAIEHRRTNAPVAA